jgi:hypothetical protein
MRAHFAAASAAALIALAGCGRYGFEDAADNGVFAQACADIPGALVCSGFEDDGDGWTLETERGGWFEATCPTPRTGSRCLVASVDSGGGAAARAWQRHPPIGSGMLYARAHLLVDGDVEIDGINVMALDAAGSNVYGPDLNLVDGGNLEVYLEEASLPSATIGPVPRGQWVCLQLAVLIDETNGSVVAGYNSTTMERQGIDTFPDGAYDYVAVGLDWTSSRQGAATVAIDDVVVATSPLSCRD